MNLFTVELRNQPGGLAHFGEVVAQGGVNMELAGVTTMAPSSSPPATRRPPAPLWRAPESSSPSVPPCRSSASTRPVRPARSAAGSPTRTSTSTPCSPSRSAKARSSSPWRSTSSTKPGQHSPSKSSTDRRPSPVQPKHSVPARMPGPLRPAEHGARHAQRPVAARPSGRHTPQSRGLQVRGQRL